MTQSPDPSLSQSPMFQNGPWPALCRVADVEVAREVAAFVVERARRLPGGGATAELSAVLRATQLEIREEVDSRGAVVFDLYWPPLSRDHGSHGRSRRMILEWGWRKGYVATRPAWINDIKMRRRWATRREKAALAKVQLTRRAGSPWWS